MTIKTFDMQFIRYMNIFSRVTRVSAKHCFLYNNMLVFIVPQFAVDQAIGRENTNLKKISEVIGKRVRIIAEPKSRKDIERFLKILVSPVEFQSLEVKDDEAIITAGMENKAMLIGRQRAREQELKEILAQYFQIKNVRIL